MIRALAAHCRPAGWALGGAAPLLPPPSPLARRPLPCRAGSGGRPPSPHYGKPGFRYQGRIYHCSCCDHPINDGSERLFTGRHDAPHGEYRYECTTCTGPGAPEVPPFNLCPGCWDRFQGGEALHERSHAFQHVGPRMTRHNDYYGNQGGGEASGSGTNPWGRPSFGGSYARALQRMKQRYGIHDLG